MKSVYFLAIIATVFTACVTNNYSSTTMVRVLHKRNYEPIDTKKFENEDQSILIQYNPDIVESGLSVQLKNKSDKPLRIIWDDSTYIRPGNTTQKIFHSGIKIIDRSNSQPSTTIPPQSILEETLVPIDGVSWGNNNWEYNPLCGTRSIYTHELDDSACMGKIFGFYITYEINGKKNSLPLKFKYVSKEELPKK